MENVLITSLFSNFLLHLIEELITNSVRLCYELCTLFEECLQCMCPFVCILLFASSLIGRALQKTTDTLQSSVEIYTPSYKPPVPYPVPDNWSQMAL